MNQVKEECKCVFVHFVTCSVGKIQDDITESQHVQECVIFFLCAVTESSDKYQSAAGWQYNHPSLPCVKWPEAEPDAKCALA